MNAGDIRLAAQKYGEQRVRMVTVERSGRHQLSDLGVGVTLTGSFDSCHETIRERMWTTAGPGHSFLGTDGAEPIVHVVCGGLDLLSAEGIEGFPDLVYRSEDEPFGLFEGAVVREDVADARHLWW